MLTIVKDALFGSSKQELAEVDSKVDQQQREQAQFNYKLAGKCSEQARAQHELKHQNEILMNRTSDMDKELVAASCKLDQANKEAERLNRNQDLMNSKLQNLQSEQNNFNLAMAQKGAVLEDRQKFMSEQQESFKADMKSQTANLQNKLGETAMDIAVMNSRTNNLSADVGRMGDKVEKFQADQNAFNHALAQKGALLEERQRMLSQQQQSFNSDINSKTNILQEKMSEADKNLVLVNSRADHISSDVKKIDDRVGKFQDEQTLFNHAIAEKGSQMEERQRLFSQQQESINTDLKSQTSVLQEKMSENFKNLELVSSRADHISTDVKKVDDRVEKFQDEQSTFNRMIAEKGSQLEILQRMSSEQQNLFNDDIKLKTGNLQEKLDGTSTGLELANCRADFLKLDQDKLGLNVARVDGKVAKLQQNQNQFNLTVAERGARVETSQEMFSKHQLSFNSDVNSRTIALQDQLGNNSTKLELVNSRADFLQHGQNELNSNLRQVSLKVEQQQSEQNQLYQAISERAVRNEVTQSYLLETQRFNNNQIMYRTDGLNEKLGAAATKLEVVNTRAEFLRDGQEKIDSTLKLERQINEDRQREITKVNQILTERNARVEERQHCFMTDQKSLNDQIINRTEKVRDRLAKASSKVDIMHFSLENLQSSHQKVESDLGETSRKVELIDHSNKELRAEQKQILAMLKDLITQMSEVSAKTELIERRLDAVQLESQKMNEKCVKCETTLKTFEKSQDEIKKDLKTLNAKAARRFYN